MVCAIAQLRCAPDISWGAGVTLSTSGVDASDPQIVMDANGNATAAWVENGLVKASYQPVGMSFGLVQTLSGSGSSSPRLGVDGSGNVTAVWLDSTGIVTASVLPFGGSWGAATAVSAAGAVTPKIVVDATGNVIAVWGRSGFIETSTKPILTGLWSVPFNFSTSSNADNPDLAISSNGTAIIVWHRVASGQDQILSSNAVIGGTWGSPLTIIAGTFHNNYPKVALDPSGNALVAWWRWVQITDFENVFVAASILSSGGVAWTPAVFLSNSGFGNPANFSLRVATDTSGNAQVIWSISYDEQTYNLEASVHQNGQAFSQLNTLVASNLYAFEVDSAVNSSSDSVIGYMFFDGTNNIIQAAESLIFGALVNQFSSPVNLSTGADNGFPRIASTITGSTLNAGAIWITNDGMNNRIVAATGSRVTVIPPSNLMISQSFTSFGVFTDYVNTLTWSPSTDPNLSEYGIFRNNIFQQVVNSSTTEFVDHNKVQNGAVTYGVSAITNTQLQSAIITKSFP